MNGLDLFSGIGGMSFALSRWVRPIAYCENDRHAQAELLQRMRGGQLCHAPIWDDVRTLRGDSLGNWIDIIYGGFPCQDLSVAGNGAGLEGERSGLVFEVFRLVRECRPKFVFLENVPALAVRGLDRVLLEFHALGFDARWTIVSAAEMGAPHLRERIWILAHANGSGLWEQQSWGERRKGSEQVEPGSDGSERHMGWIPNCDNVREKRSFCNGAASYASGVRKKMAHSDCLRESQLAERRNLTRNGLVNGSEEVADAESIGSIEGRLPSRQKPQYALSGVSDKCFAGDFWKTEPDVGRVVNGVPARMDRLRGLGNAVVPQAAREAFERLMGITYAA